MSGRTNSRKWLAAFSGLLCLVQVCGCAVDETYVSPNSQSGGPIVMRVASSQNSSAFEAGRQAALAL